jgi:hypothetical protein
MIKQCSLFLLLAGWALLAGPDLASAAWLELEPGLDLGHFDSRLGDWALPASSDLVALRIDPRRWELKVLACDQDESGSNLDSWDWCRRHGLVAAINAGMYQADHRTHVGYLKVDGKVINSGVNDYLSAMAVGPLDPRDPPFHIFDLDETPLAEVESRYRTVAQNLRLIKRPAENRWQPSTERWREAALAEDGQGRCLFIYCDRRLSMHDFNELLGRLPLDIVAAQHLEGSGPAKLWIDHSLVGARMLPDGRNPGPLLPNILGVAPLSEDEHHPREDPEQQGPDQGEPGTPGPPDAN